ncbi:MAG: PEGA domain-containing protein [Deltaproteobacteria bacterium]|nr:PEGA domain-containing protein [Deltaproteobacteria bacterium]
MAVLASLLGLAVLAGPGRAEPLRPEDSPKPEGGSKRAPISLLLLDTLDIGLEAGTARQARTSLEQALGRLEHVQLSRPDALLSRMSAVPEQVRADLARAVAYVEKGRESLLNLALDEAVESFQSARVLYRRQMAYLEDPDPLVKALMGLAESLAAGGDQEAAASAYREVLVLSPGYEPDPGMVPSKFRSLFEQVRQEASDAPSGGLVVETEPRGASARLDGLTVGTSPLILSAIPAGLHALKLEKKGYAALRKVVEIQRGETTPVQVELQPLRLPALLRQVRTAACGEDPRECEKLLREIGSIGSMTGVVLSQLARLADGRTVLTLAVVRAQGGACVLGARWSPQTAEEVSRSLAWQISDAVDRAGTCPAPPSGLGLHFERSLLGSVEPPSPIAIRRLPQVTHRAVGVAELPPRPIPDGVPPPPPDVTPLWGEWWFWTGIGALVAGGVATALALTLSGREETIYEPDLVRVKIWKNP